MSIRDGYSSVVTLTRTADTNAYTANDVVGSSVAAGGAVLTFPGSGITNSDMMVTSVQLQINDTGVISGETSYRLYLYNATPPSALADNAAFDLGTSDRYPGPFIGYVDLGTPVDLGTTLYVETSNINKQLKMGATSQLFGYLVTNGAYTPTSARVYIITLHLASI